MDSCLRRNDGGGRAGMTEGGRHGFLHGNGEGAGGGSEGLSEGWGVVIEVVAWDSCRRGTYAGRLE